MCVGGGVLGGGGRCRRRTTSRCAWTTMPMPPLLQKPDGEPPADTEMYFMQPSGPELGRASSSTATSFMGALAPRAKAGTSALTTVARCAAAASPDALKYWHQARRSRNVRAKELRQDVSRPSFS